MAHYDALETRDPELRAREQFALLSRRIAYAKARAPALAHLYADVDAAAITSREALATLPVIRKSELAELQKQARPFGGLAATGWGAIRRVFASPGGIYEPEGAAPDYWRLARALFAAKAARDAARAAGRLRLPARGLRPRLLRRRGRRAAARARADGGERAADGDTDVGWLVTGGDWASSHWHAGRRVAPL